MGKPQQDLTGQNFGDLTVIQYVGNSMWKCLCTCGNYKECRTSSLKSGNNKSCGCKKTRTSNFKEDLRNKKFVNLIPIEYIKGGKWRCKCECGNETIVDTRNLKSGHTTSCGCLKLEKLKNNAVDMTGYKNQGIQVLEREGSTNNGIATWRCKCLYCGREFITEGSHIRNGQTRSCGCVHSRNEQKITQMLLENGVEFATQYTFSDLLGINNGPLRFDFAIFKDHKLSHLIEYNGKQHYEKTSGKWGESYENLVQNDRRKIKYCNQNNIELRIITYDQTYNLNDLI